MLARKAQI